MDLAYFSLRKVQGYQTLQPLTQVSYIWVNRLARVFTLFQAYHEYPPSLAQYYSWSRVEKKSTMFISRENISNLLDFYWSHLSKNFPTLLSFLLVGIDWFY